MAVYNKYFNFICRIKLIYMYLGIKSQLQEKREY